MYVYQPSYIHWYPISGLWSWTHVLEIQQLVLLDLAARSKRPPQKHRQGLKWLITGLIIHKYGIYMGVYVDIHIYIYGIYMGIYIYVDIHIYMGMYIYMDVNDSYMDFWGADHSIGVTYWLITGYNWLFGAQVHDFLRARNLEDAPFKIGMRNCRIL
jgi:hypothetical protein